MEVCEKRGSSKSSAEVYIVCNLLIIDSLSFGMLNRINHTLVQVELWRQNDKGKNKGCTYPKHFCVKFARLPHGNECFGIGKLRKD